MPGLVFFGTPDFAVPTLEALCQSGREPGLVVSQPSRPQGRRKLVVDPPIIRFAERRRLPTVQPRKVSDPEFLDHLEELRPDVAIVVAFGQIFRPELLELPRLGCINLHASLLPRFRGAAPIQAAIVAGDSVTGVTTMFMNEGLDTGDILLQQQVDIGATETAAELSNRLAETGGNLVVRTVELLEVDGLDRRPQDDSKATFAPRLDREAGRIDWTRSSAAVFDQIRGLIPWPGTWSTLRDTPTKILWGLPVEPSSPRDAAPGTLLGLENRRLIVACGGATVFGVERLQRSGRRAVDAVAFVNGEHLEPGERFG